MSEPALKRQLAEALLKIKQLEQAAPKELVKTVVEYRDVPYRVDIPVVEYRDREVVREVPGPTKIQIEYIDREVIVERVVEKEVVREVKQPKETIVIEKPVDRIVYVDKPYPVHVPVVEYRDRVIEKIVTEPAKTKVVYQDREVVRVETKTETEVIEKQVYVPVEVIKEVTKEVYVDNPEHLKTIALLQEKLCQYISQSGS